MKQIDNKRKGVWTAAVGIACNVLLSAAKITVGVLFGMISVAADGFNNLSDCGSGAVSLVSVCVAAKPADKHHPYGHRRAEYVAAMITGFLVLVVAVELLQSAIEGIVSGAQGSVNWIVYVVLGVSLAVKAGMAVMYRTVGKRIGSDSLLAASTDSLCDCVATFAVILGAVLAVFGIAADGWVGIAVALFVGWQGVRLVRDASSQLLGRAPSEQQINDVKAQILSFEGVLGLHDLHVFSYGNGVAYATVHVEMSADLSAVQAHAVLDAIERQIKRDQHIDLTAHLDPVDVNDTRAQQLEQAVRQAVAGIADGIEIHDFRLVRGAVDRLVFDAGVPFDTKLSDAEIERQIVQEVRLLGDMEVSVTVERE